MATIAAGRWRTPAFAAGALLLSIGVVLHLPMFVTDALAGRHFMAMPFDAAMIVGMAAIALGTALAAAALWRPMVRHAWRGTVIAPPVMRGRHWLLVSALVLVLVIDTMKPATLGFVVPGMSGEYGLPRARVAWLPFAALTGTVVGSVLWGWFADHQGRRAAILLSTLLFIGTAICGAMPTFEWNVAMCFVMGASAGGLLPVAYALLTEMLPERRRGLFLVLVGGLGSAGGFFAASGLASVLEPLFGWRVMWLIGLPTGIVVLLFSLWLPESPAYLVRVGRIAEAREAIARYGGRLAETAAGGRAPPPLIGSGRHPIAALVAAGLLWGLVNFGLLLWLPALMSQEGTGVQASGRLLAGSSFIAFLTIVPAALAYARLGGARSLFLALSIMLAGLLGIALAGAALSAVLLLLIGLNAVIAILLPHAAECAPVRTRGRAIGWVAAASKAGGLLAQAVTLLGLAPGAGQAALALAIPLLLLLVAMAVRMRRTAGFSPPD